MLHSLHNFPRDRAQYRLGWRPPVSGWTVQVEVDWRLCAFDARFEQDGRSRRGSRLRSLGAKHAALAPRVAAVAVRQPAAAARAARGADATRDPMVHAARRRGALLAQSLHGVEVGPRAVGQASVATTTATRIHAISADGAVRATEAWAGLGHAAMRGRHRRSPIVPAAVHQVTATGVRAIVWAVLRHGVRHARVAATYAGVRHGAGWVRTVCMWAVRNTRCPHWATWHLREQRAVAVRVACLHAVALQPVALQVHLEGSARAGRCRGCQQVFTCSKKMQLTGDAVTQVVYTGGTGVLCNQLMHCLQGMQLCRGNANKEGAQRREGSHLLCKNGMDH